VKLDCEEMIDNSSGYLEKRVERGMFDGKYGNAEIECGIMGLIEVRGRKKIGERATMALK
jgi:hypothetical protein